MIDCNCRVQNNSVPFIIRIHTYQEKISFLLRGFKFHTHTHTQKEKKEKNSGSHIIPKSRNYVRQFRSQRPFGNEILFPGKIQRSNVKLRSISAAANTRVKIYKTAGRRFSSENSLPVSRACFNSEIIRKFSSPFPSSPATYPPCRNLPRLIGSPRLSPRFSVRFAANRRAIKFESTRLKRRNFRAGTKFTRGTRYRAAKAYFISPRIIGLACFAWHTPVVVGRNGGCRHGLKVFSRVTLADLCVICKAPLRLRCYFKSARRSLVTRTCSPVIACTICSERGCSF